MVKIEYSNEADFQYILDNDKYISRQLINGKLREKEIIVAKGEHNKIIVG